MTTEIIFCGNRINKLNRLGLEIQISMALDSGSEEVHIMFGSPGGEIFQALEFYKFITNLPSNKKAKLYIHSCGPIESSAVVIFVSFDNRYVSDNSHFLLHKVRLQNMTALTKEQQQNIDYFNNQMLGILTSKVTLDQTEIDSLQTTYENLNLTSEIAIQKKFGQKSSRKFLDTAIIIPQIGQ
ncbi:hypothetical protein FLA105534_00267 [Flavobacterium bizetiae]|uniref:ATP-dependent Clp protease proteolytic subunit n=1 Tax=Flavobacterium bizetiae TaxID=2704140 RepID=A0A6J4G9E7_9FLAO|nr:ATP-dependent Clp protease proteolytic subunit [Flavobacterium bizetiae]CAA9194677.1 hypothetical protein FLA105534_00267 [Flavobacterium bizetiae]CAD5343600.1 hypothetical protein FLA105535_03600 [Flavobacterium bizetiae]CAD5347793.1 hypothetical protein FLA105534_01752 [Flavobacterium bizetiae]